MTSPEDPALPVPDADGGPVKPRGPKRWGVEPDWSKLPTARRPPVVSDAPAWGTSSIDARQLMNLPVPDELVAVDEEDADDDLPVAEGDVVVARDARDEVAVESIAAAEVAPETSVVEDAPSEPLVAPTAPVEPPTAEPSDGGPADDDPYKDVPFFDEPPSDPG